MKLPNAKVGFSKAMSNGWILVDKAVNPPLVKKKVPEIKDLVGIENSTVFVSCVNCLFQ